MTDRSGRTIRDFGRQWACYPDNEGYYASVEYLRDLCGPLLDAAEIRGKRVLDIGSGSGRIAGMLLAAGAEQVIAIEPSEAFEQLLRNTRPWKDRITCLKMKGEEISGLSVDYCFSIGVLHHIPDPEPVIARAFDCLKPGGKFLVWVYGNEGRRLFLSLLRLSRKLTSRMPDGALAVLSRFLNFFLGGYAFLCRRLPLPFREYMVKVITPLNRRNRFLVIFDQLNPSYARYDSRGGIEQSMKKAGFSGIEHYHRHQYSWTIAGEKKIR
ncbi:MAG: class I SAM-dependent methyltransferase [Acidobacteriota bacterium]|nr:class I SAM-dependent methyltransferase [Acidobacteriota bacterium]MDD8034493.1 class I SAM-dependent methyltransferase [Acidobacteriota bacterium]MDD8039508.1 class I SAM-dependent methyltransferase [Acidobacteriota bacterium]